jgi:hypothetical protein
MLECPSRQELMSFSSTSQGFEGSYFYFFWVCMSFFSLKTAFWYVCLLFFNFLVGFFHLFLMSLLSYFYLFSLISWRIHPVARSHIPITGNSHICIFRWRCKIFKNPAWFSYFMRWKVETGDTREGTGVRNTHISVQCDSFSTTDILSWVVLCCRRLFSVL